MIHIDYLAEKLHAVDVLAEWMFHEWLAPMGFTREFAADYVLSRCQRDKVPIAFVALEGMRPVGMVNLVEDTMPDGVTPIHGLAGLFVEPMSRGRGVGKQLCGRAVLEAQQLRLNRLSVYTVDQQEYFARLGWVRVGETVEQLPTAQSVVAYMELPIDCSDALLGLGERAAASIPTILK